MPDGFDAFCIADLSRALAPTAEERAVVLVHIARDEQRARAFNETLAFVAPEIEILDFPGWDCQPYDRVSPNAAISARRMTVLSRLARSRTAAGRPRILSTTVNAVLQRVPPREKVAAELLFCGTRQCRQYDQPDGMAAEQWLCARVRRARLPVNMPCAAAFSIFSRRLCWSRSGSISSAIRWNRSAPFDPETQRTVAPLRAVDLVPVSEAQLTTDSMRRFRQGYVGAFGGGLRGDTLYEAVSEGRRHPGLEHWLPLFYDGLDTLFDYIGGAPLVLDPLTDEAATERLAQIRDYYDARKHAHDSDPSNSAYKPLPPEALYLPVTNGRNNLRRKAPRASRLFRRRKAARRSSSIAAANSDGISLPSAPTRAQTFSTLRPNMFRRSRRKANASSSPAGRKVRASVSVMC